MNIINQRTELVPIDSVQPHPRNPHQGDVGAITASIDHTGFYGALIVQEATRRILVGNHRWMAARHAGAQQIPATFVDVDDEAALRILLADNRLARLASDDSNALAELLQELAATPSGLSGSGYDGDALDELLADLGHAVTNFEPVGLDDQGRLDRKATVICPHCRHEFTP